MLARLKPRYFNLVFTGQQKENQEHNQERSQEHNQNNGLELLKKVIETNERNTEQGIKTMHNQTD